MEKKESRQSVRPAQPSPPTANVEARPKDPAVSAGGCLLRLGWMVVGNIVLAVTAVAIGRTSVGFSSFTVADVIYVLTLVALVAIRYYDIARFQGRTADNRPATMSDFVRYSVILVAIAAAVWVVMRLHIFFA